MDEQQQHADESLMTDAGHAAQAKFSTGEWAVTDEELALDPRSADGERSFVSAYADDLVVGATSDRQLERRLWLLFTCLTEQGFYLSPGKIQTWCKGIEWIGTVITSVNGSLRDNADVVGDQVHRSGDSHSRRVTATLCRVGY